MKISITGMVLGALFWTSAGATEVVRCEWRDFKGQVDVAEVSLGKKGSIRLCTGPARCIVEKSDQTTAAEVRIVSCPMMHGKCPLATDCIHSSQSKLGKTDVSEKNERLRKPAEQKFKRGITQ